MGPTTNWTELHDQHDLDLKTINDAGLTFKPPFEDPEQESDDPVVLEYMVITNYQAASVLAKRVRAVINGGTPDETIDSL